MINFLNNQIGGEAKSRSNIFIGMRMHMIYGRSNKTRADGPWLSLARVYTTEIGVSVAMVSSCFAWLSRQELYRALKGAA